MQCTDDSNTIIMIQLNQMTINVKNYWLMSSHLSHVWWPLIEKGEVHLESLASLASLKVGWLC